MATAFRGVWAWRERFKLLLRKEATKDHRRMKAGLLAVVLVGAATFVANSGVMAQERVLRVRIGSDIIGMDPARLFNIENQTMCNQIYNGLTKYDYGKTNQLLPDLAERWDLSPEGPPKVDKLIFKLI